MPAYKPGVIPVRMLLLGLKYRKDDMRAEVTHLSLSARAEVAPCWFSHSWRRGYRGTAIPIEAYEKRKPNYCHPLASGGNWGQSSCKPDAVHQLSLNHACNRGI